MEKVVRVVARIKPSTEPSRRSILIDKPIGEDSETVSISFGAQFAGSKGSYKLDYCYEESETTGLILTKEIKPLISSVFEGKDANVIAHGARSSGKTHLIQGNEKEFGLAVLTISEMLAMAKERGDSISVSVYEVSHETVYDLLDQEKPVVTVLEGAQGKIQLKGLSQVPVKSLSEFQNLYFGLKKIQKLTIDPHGRSHKGVMIHVITGSNAKSGSLVRMNFLDMAGYEDSKIQNSALAPSEIARINRSIYALQNVMYALNANESHVPYRESKLTHMLKDCLQGCNRTLLITCLPREFSKDSFYMLNLASRICLGSSRTLTNPNKKKITTLASSSSAAQRRQTPLVSRLNTTSSAVKGRKLFCETNDLKKSENNSKKMEGKTRMTLKNEMSTSKVVLSVQASSSKEEVCSSFVVTDSQSSLVEENSLAFSCSAVAMESTYSTIESLSSEVADTTDKETPLKHEEKFSGATHCDDAFADKGEKLDKKNNSLLANETASPPLSLRLQELSNTLKSICKTSNQLSVPDRYQTSLTKSQAEDVSEVSDITTEAVVSVGLRSPEKTMPSNIGCSPWKTYSAHSSKLKNSAVGEYLKFLNTAEKEDLKKLKGIGEKRAAYIVELREESPFKTLDDLRGIGLSAKQVKGLLINEIGEISMEN